MDFCQEKPGRLRLPEAMVEYVAAIKRTNELLGEREMQAGDWRGIDIVVVDSAISQN